MRQPALRTVTLAAVLAAVSLAAQPPASVRLPAGQHLTLELQEDLHTRYSQKGDPARFSVTQDIQAGSQVVIPQGSTIRATLSEVKRPGRGGSPGCISLHFDEVELPDGTKIALDAKLLRAGFFDADRNGAAVKGSDPGSGPRRAATVAMDAGEGALLGVAIGGGKGAGYGSAVGAGIGLIQILMEKGPHLELPRGTLFEIVLARELEVPTDALARLAQNVPRPAAAAPDAGAAAEAPPPATAEEVPNFENDTASAEKSASTAPAEAMPNDSMSLPSGPLPPPLPPGQDDPYRMKVDVRLVLVDAVVRSANGRPLDQLTRDDFRVFEDGVEQKIRAFSRDELPLAVALVVDRSGSVAPFMPELRQAAYQALQQLKPGDQVALFAFDSQVDRLENLTTDRRRIAERIARIQAGGGTNITGALYEAALYLHSAAPERRRAVILISDNQATVRGVGQERVIQTALEAETVIYSIKTPGEGLPLLMRLATQGAGSVRKMTQETGGEIIDVESTGSLRAALAAVVSRLKTRYTLGYQSTNKARDGGFRRIDVRLADRFGRVGDNYSVYAKKGYYAPAEQVASQPPR